MGGQQAAINESKQADLDARLVGCCTTGGVCLAVFLCQDVFAMCENGTCTLAAIATPTPTPQHTADSTADLRVVTVPGNELD
jgi:hypothetical protein